LRVFKHGLIYFDAALQKKVIPIFHYALKPNGYLVLGSAESIGGFVDLFAVADAKHRIYEKKFSRTRQTKMSGHYTELQTRSSVEMSGHTRTVEPLPADIRKQADAVVLSKFAPDGVVVNSSMEILQFRGNTGPFLENHPGEANLNLLKMARQGLALALRPLISKSAKKKSYSEISGIQVRHDGRMLTVTVKIIPLLMPNCSEPFFLVLFEKESAVNVAALKKSTPIHSTTEQRELEQLRDELDATKRALQNIIEDQDAANEELRAANEEILSSNEELQSTNEEMGTATEELQSTNAELITLNDELQTRNVELQELSDDMGNLFSSVDIPILMLTNDLCIRRFTPRAVNILNLIAGDVGRPISDFKIKLNLPNLQEMITEVIETLNVKELDVQDLDSRWFSLRIRPYKTSDNRINGVVLTLQDIDTVKRALAQVKAERSYAEAILATLREPLLVLSSDLRVKFANQSFYTLFRTKPDHTQGLFIYEISDHAWDIPQLRELLEKILPKKSTFQNFCIEHDFPGIGPKSILLNARRLAPDIGQPPLILLAMEDVTKKTAPP
jgi:two-component system CheB/CheR fusion protein